MSSPLLPPEVIEAAEGDPYFLILSEILDSLSEGRFLPQLRTAYFATNVNGFSLLIPPITGNSIFVSLFNISSDGLCGCTFGQGTTAGDFEPFPSYFNSSTARLSGEFYINSFTNFNMSVSRPNFIFRTDPSKGFLLNQIGSAANVSGFINYWVAETSGKSIGSY